MALRWVSKKRVRYVTVPEFTLVSFAFWFLGCV